MRIFLNIRHPVVLRKGEKMRRTFIEHKFPQIGWKRRQEVHERSGWRCWFCGRDFSKSKLGPPYRSDTPTIDIPTVEHLLPLIRGGSSSPENLVTACKRCNTKKRFRTVEEYRAYLVGLSPIAHAKNSLLELIDRQYHVDASIHDALEWLESQIPIIQFYGERKA